MHRTIRFLTGVALGFGSVWLAALASFATEKAVAEIVVTNDLVLERGAQLAVRLVVRANHVSIDGNGATLQGPGQVGEATALESAGIGILIEGVVGVTLKDVQVHGFAIGLVLRQARAVTITDCDFSDNYHNPKHGWGELPARGGILLEHVHHSVLRANRANRVWDGLHLIDADDNLIADNDFSHCSNTCAKLWKSSRNKFLNNNLSFSKTGSRTTGSASGADGGTPFCWPGMGSRTMPGGTISRT